MVSNISNLSPKSKKVKHILAVTGTYMMLFGFIFTFLQIFFGFIPIVRNFSFGGIPIAPILFALIAIIIINKYVVISSEHEDKD